MKTLHKKGWLLKISSWENDGDHRNTVELAANSSEKAKQMFEFSSLFKDTERSNRIGNIYEPDNRDIQNILRVAKAFIVKYPGFIETQDGDDDEQIVECFIETAYDYGLTRGEQYTRLCETVEVLYFPEDVLYEDVTKEYR